jgi:hypothetical protein
MRKEKSPRQNEPGLLPQHVDIHGRLLHHPYQQTVDLVVYRPAGGAGRNESRRLRLGGKQRSRLRCSPTGISL